MNARNGKSRSWLMELAQFVAQLVTTENLTAAIPFCVSETRKQQVRQGKIAVLPKLLFSALNLLKMPIFCKTCNLTAQCIYDCSKNHNIATPRFSGAHIDNVLYYALSAAVY